MSVTIPIRAIELTPGSMISIHNLSWQDFEQLLAELGAIKSGGCRQAIATERICQ